ncbi:MAG: hypothetical protein ACK5B9_10030 [Flavobacteriia bacterium]|jgi:hypothetical protein
MDFEDEFDEEDFHKERKAEFKRIKSLKILKKSEDILDLVLKICELIEPEDNPEAEILREIKEIIQYEALMIPPKIIGAESVEYYDLKMENAVIIRKSAMEVSLHCTSLEMYGFKEVSYLNLVRDEVNSFRDLFVEWIASFDKSQYIGDLWNVFNPPGTSLDDVRKNLEDI